MADFVAPRVRGLLGVADDSLPVRGKLFVMVAKKELTDEQLERFAGHQVVVSYGFDDDGWMVPIDIVSLNDLNALETMEDFEEMV